MTKTHNSFLTPSFCHSQYHNIRNKRHFFKLPFNSYSPPMPIPLDCFNSITIIPAIIIANNQYVNNLVKWKLFADAEVQGSRISWITNNIHVENYLILEVKMFINCVSVGMKSSRLSNWPSFGKLLNGNRKQCKWTRVSCGSKTNERRTDATTLTMKRVYEFMSQRNNG